MNTFMNNMRSYFALTAIFLACVFAFHATARAQDSIAKSAPSNDGFTPLFNGKDLAGWQTTGRWGYDSEGAVALQPPFARRRLIPDYQSFLWTKATYTDFVLDLEFKLAKDTSSGVFMRSASTRSYIQAQIRDSYGKAGLGNDTAGALVDVAAPNKNAAKPAGQWNHLTITCNGPSVQVELNGEKIVNTDLSKSREANSARTGRLGFENAGSPIAFRNVKIKELKH